LETNPVSPFVHIGTSSFSEKDWVGPFYPEGTKPRDFLKIYAEHYGAVEIDATYYAVPARKAVESWAAKTPEDFVICAKFPRSIVHCGEGPKPDATKILLAEHTYEERDRFLDVISNLGSRIGPLVLQFPYFSKEIFPKAGEFIDRLDRFLADLPTDYRYAVEIRNRYWLKSSFANLLKNHNVALVLVDQSWMPMADEVEKLFDPVTTDFCYIRLLGDRREIEAITKSWDKEVIDRSERLERWADYIFRLHQKQVRTYIFINNHYAGHAPATLRRLEELFRKRLGNG